MAKFLIEVPHEAEISSCAKAVQAFLLTGSHFMTHADWGCEDGEHKAWITVELGSKEEARNILPPNYRKEAKIVCLRKFNLEEIDEILAQHQ